MAVVKQNKTKQLSRYNVKHAGAITNAFMRSIRAGMMSRKSETAREQYKKSRKDHSSVRTRDVSKGLDIRFPYSKTRPCRVFITKATSVAMILVKIYIQNAFVRLCRSGTSHNDFYFFCELARNGKSFGWLDGWEEVGGGNEI